MTPESLNKDKARRAAKHPERPGEQCRAEPGRWVPRIDRNRCEGKADCVEVCPYGVFEVRRMADEDFAGLRWVGKLKAIARHRSGPWRHEGGANHQQWLDGDP